MPTAEMLFEEAKQPLDISCIPLRPFLDIPYARDSAAQMLDIALPPAGDGPFPVIVYFHGGGWYYGDKRNVHTRPAWESVPAAGFALVSVNYRLSGEATWPAQLDDAKAALRFLRAHGGEYGLDAGRIGVWGNSAGGQIAAMLAVAGGDPAVQAACVWYGIYDIPAFQSQWARVLSPGEATPREDVDTLAALLGGPATADNPAALQASARTYIRAGLPPMFLLHGKADRVVPYLQTAEFAAEYRRANGSEKLYCEIIDGAGHGGPAFYTEKNLGNMLSFFRRWLN